VWQVDEKRESVVASQYCKMTGIMSLISCGFWDVYSGCDGLGCGKKRSGDFGFGGAMYGT